MKTRHALPSAPLSVAVVLSALCTMCIALILRMRDGFRFAMGRTGGISYRPCLRTHRLEHRFLTPGALPRLRSLSKGWLASDEWAPPLDPLAVQYRRDARMCLAAFLFCLLGSAHHTSHWHPSMAHALYNHKQWVMKIKRENETQLVLLLIRMEIGERRE